MTTLLIVISGLFLAFSLLILMSGGSKYRKFIKSLEIDQNVKVYVPEYNKISTYFIKEIDRGERTVLLSDNKTYSFNDLLY